MSYVVLDPDFNNYDIIEDSGLDSFKLVIYPDCHFQEPIPAAPYPTIEVESFDYSYRGNFTGKLVVGTEYSWTYICTRKAVA